MESNLKGFIWLELGLFLLQSIFFLLLYLKLTNCVCSIGCCLVSMMSHKDLMQKFLFMLVMYMKDLTFFLVKEFHVHRQCLPVCIWCTLHVPHSTRDVPTISPVPSLAEQTRGCAEMYRDAQAGWHEDIGMDREKEADNRQMNTENICFRIRIWNLTWQQFCILNYPCIKLYLK